MYCRWLLADLELAEWLDDVLEAIDSFFCGSELAGGYRDDPPLLLGAGICADWVLDTVAVLGGWVCESGALLIVRGRSEESVTSDAIEFGSVVLSGTTNPYTK